MYKILLFIAFSLVSTFIIGQGNAVVSNKKHKIIFQMASKDTTDHSALIRQLNNLKKLAPKSQLEVVCHGPGLQLIHKEKSNYTRQVESLISNGVDFVACEFTMQQKKVKKEQLIAKTRTVPGGILEIVEKEEKGWSYIKAGL
ncbi:MAG: DsrE family protein [Saprospiraceae bacterium]